MCLGVPSAGLNGPLRGRVRHNDWVDPVTAEEVLSMPYFAALTQDEAIAVASDILVHHFDPREVIAVAGEETKGLYFIRSGTVRVYRMGRDGREQSLRLASSGDTFGEVPVFDGQPMPAHVEAIKPTELLLVPTSLLKEVVRRHPEVSIKLLELFARRIRAFVELVEQLSLQTVEARLARYLFQLARMEGVERDGEVIVQRDLTVQDLAALLGSVREVVARQLHALQEEGVIRVERKEIAILDMELLRRML